MTLVPPTSIPITGAEWTELSPSWTIVPGEYTGTDQSDSSEVPMELPQKPSLDTVSGVPLYSQVKEWLLGGIRDGWWAVGTPLGADT